jgi:hypothetical protein
MSHKHDYANSGRRPEFGIIIGGFGLVMRLGQDVVLNARFGALDWRKGPVFDGMAVAEPALE